MKTVRICESLRRDRRAVSPAVSTVIITSAIIVMVLVAMVYADSFLNTRLAENEFATNKQFMLTAALQLDDIAWTMGRTQTIRYSCRLGSVSFEGDTLGYLVEVYSGGSWQQILTCDTGVIMYNMPTAYYSLTDDYFQRIFPSSNGSFVQQGPSAPITHVYVVEKLPMGSGSFTRVVVAPTIRMLNSTIDSLEYVKFYLPSLIEGESLYLSQSVTMMGKSVARTVQSDVTQVRFNVTYPKMSEGYDSQFFNFESESWTYTFPVGSVIEFYVGEVTVSLGIHV